MLKRPQWSIPCAAVIFMVSILMVPLASAQVSTSATLRGVIKDPTGAVVPSAKVTLISDRTKSERSVKSSGEGVYAFTLIEPGIYTITVEASGFKKHSLNG